MELKSALQFAQNKLSKTSDAPRLDAERLLLHVLGQTESAWLYAHAEDPLTPSQEKRFRQLVTDRATGRPLAYILGEWEFYGRPFFVTPDVLIPRPETENLIEAAFRYIDMWRGKNNRGITIADIGTGSGCIAITLALELSTPTPASRQVLPLRKGEKITFRSLRRRGALSERSESRSGVVILATDISSAALAVAKKNAQRHGVADKIEFFEEDMATTLENHPAPPQAGHPSFVRRGKIDLIVSNPPYIPSQELDRPKPPASSAGRLGVQSKSETAGLRFEPRLALDGGPDGQTFVEQIKNAGIPALVETTGGNILTLGITQTSLPSQE